MNDRPIFAESPLEQVREGMTVVDADGTRLGTVKRIQVGDPRAVTSVGNEPNASGAASAVAGPATAASGGLVGFQAVAGSDPEGFGDIPDTLHRSLRRAGFVEVDGPGLEGADRFLPGDRIAEVSGDHVRLHPAATEPGAAASASGASPTYTARAEHRDVPAAAAERLVYTTSHDRSPSSDRSGQSGLVVGGAGALLFGGAGVAGWLYVRRRREQSRPINRLRRASARLGERLPDDAPIGTGALGSALLLLLLALAGRARRDTRPTERDDTPDTSQAMSVGAERLRGILPALDDRTDLRERVSSRPNLLRLGLAAGLLAGVSGAAVLIRQRARAERSIVSGPGSPDVSRP